MSIVSSKDAEKHFGQMLEMVHSDDVHIQIDGVDVAVALSPARYRDLLKVSAGPKVRARVEELLEESMVRWDAVYRALADKPE